MRCSKLRDENIVEELYRMALEHNIWFRKSKVLAIKCYETDISSEFILYLPHRTVRVIVYSDGKTLAVVGK